MGRSSVVDSTLRGSFERTFSTIENLTASICQYFVELEEVDGALNCTELFQTDISWRFDGIIATGDKLEEAEEDVSLMLDRNFGFLLCDNDVDDDDDDDDDNGKQGGNNGDNRRESFSLRKV